MKKSFFSFLALMAMGCICFNSCSKNSDKEPDQTPTEPETPIEVNFVMTIVENQQKYVDQTFEFDVNGETVSFSASQMNKVANPSMYAEYKIAVDKAITFMKEQGEPADKYDMYDYKLGTLTLGQSVTAKKLTFKILDNRPKDHEFPYFQGWDVCNVSGKEPSSMLNVGEVLYHKCISTDLDSMTIFCGMMSKKFSFTATYNKK